MNKKRLIAYILAMSTLAGCHSVKKNEDIKIIEETIPTTVTEINDDIYNCHSKSMSYGADFDIIDNEENITESTEATHQSITGQFYLITEDSLVYDHYGNILANLEKYEKIILINNYINEYNYAYIQLSNGYKGYVNYSNLKQLSDQVIDLKHDYYFNSYNENNIKINNSNTSIQPSVYKFAKENSVIYDFDGNIIDNIEKYDIIHMLDSNNNIAYVELTNGLRGFINNDLLHRLPESYVEVDISEQTLYAFNENELVLKADVVTGNPAIRTTSGTNLGYTEINGTKVLIHK